jgi:hypothetical protein
MARYLAIRKTTEQMATIKRGIEARVKGIRRDLETWLDEVHEPADSTPVSLALLETAIDRYLDFYEPPEAFEMIEAVFRRVVRQRKSIQ